MCMDSMVRSYGPVYGLNAMCIEKRSVHGLYGTMLHDMRSCVFSDISLCMESVAWCHVHYMSLCVWHDMRLCVCHDMTSSVWQNIILWPNAMHHDMRPCVYRDMTQCMDSMTWWHYTYVCLCVISDDISRSVVLYICVSVKYCDQYSQIHRNIRIKTQINSFDELNKSSIYVFEILINSNEY